jgi:hypothetical protein
MTFHILGISTSQLMNPYFSEGLKPPTSLPFQQLTCAKYVGLLDGVLGGAGMGIDS